MEFFNSAVDTLQTIVVGLGGALCVWGGVNLLEVHNMAFFNSAIEVLQTLVVALGAGLGVWGAINLMEGYGNDNPGANAHVR